MYDTDTQLMLDFQKGDEKAFETLMVTYLPRIANTIYRYTGSNADAEDIAQEVFLRVYRSKENFRPEAKFSTWLYTIVTRLCLNELRNRGRHKLQRMPEEFDLEDKKTLLEHKPFENAEQTELAACIKNALNELPENQRIAVILNKWDNLSYEEIAGTMGISVMAIKSLLSRARENLKDKLRHYI